MTEQNRKNSSKETCCRWMEFSEGNENEKKVRSELSLVALHPH